MKTNTPNPLVPQGTFLDPKAKSHLRMTVFLIIAGHLVLISGLLMAGCKKTAEPPPDQSAVIPSTFDNSNLPPVTTSPPPAAVSTDHVPPVVPSNPPPVVNNPPPVPPPTFTEGEREHTVVAGDSFYKLAKKYNVTMKAIEAVNPGVDSKRLKLGQKIKIPAATGASPTAHNAVAPTEGAERIHVVKSGETLTGIAKAEGSSVKAIRAANNLRTTRITVGFKLKIPSKAAAAAPAAAMDSAMPAAPVSPISTSLPAPITPGNP